MACSRDVQRQSQRVEWQGSLRLKTRILIFAGVGRRAAAAHGQFEFQAQHAVAGQHSIQPPLTLAHGSSWLNSPALHLCWHLGQQHNPPAAQLSLSSPSGASHAVHAVHAAHAVPPL